MAGHSGWSCEFRELRKKNRAANLQMYSRYLYIDMYIYIYMYTLYILLYNIYIYFIVHTYIFIY